MASRFCFSSYLEDAHRYREMNGVQILATLRTMGLNALRLMGKTSIARMSRAAGLARSDARDGMRLLIDPGGRGVRGASRTRRGGPLSCWVGPSLESCVCHISVTSVTVPYVLAATVIKEVHVPMSTDLPALIAVLTMSTFLTISAATESPIATSFINHLLRVNTTVISGEPPEKPTSPPPGDNNTNPQGKSKRSPPQPPNPPSTR